MPDPTEMTTTVSVSRKLNDGNFGSGEVFLNISGITATTTPDEMDEMLDQANLAFGKIREALKDKIQKALATR